jgi:hypothetical protein
VGLRAIERRLEQMVEGTFARVFKSGVRPVEIGRRLVREMDDRRSIGVNGRPVAPNAFTVRLSPEDHEQMAGIRESLIRELSNAAREHARDESYGFLGPITFDIQPDELLHTGQFRVSGRLAEGEGAGTVGTLVLPTGQRVVLGEFVLTIGRLPECTITLADTNVSRKHAEVRPEGAGFMLSDLGSTNGTFVNGARITQHELADGDVITFGGAAKITFEAS